MQQLDPLGHRLLERLAAGDQPHPAGALVDHRGVDGVREVVLAGGAARVDQPHAAEVAVGDLPARPLDRVVLGELLVHQRAGVAELDRGVAAVVLGQFLLDDVGLDGDADVVRLPGEVRRDVVVDAVLLEGAVAEVAPEHGEHAELVRVLERLGDLLDLAAGVVRAEVDGGADAGRAELERLIDRGEEGLVVAERVGQRLVVVELDDERQLRRPAARHRAEHPEGRGEGVAAALVGEPAQVLRVEVGGVRRERGGARVLDPLVDRQDREVAGAGEAAARERPVQRTEHVHRTVRRHQHPVDEVRPGEVQQLAGDAGAGVVERDGALAERLADGVDHHVFLLSRAF